MNEDMQYGRMTMQPDGATTDVFGFLKRLVQL